ncbi:hypothetical protein [Devosia sp. SD17-2]|uniref:hypothetical protein n=1 Tax=Devosia sp. SD17-2 TaxID=2976459 RepID=UPI0023D87799|nr:hypothetical protein [Devosia sp. SD17-2]WEJ33873.1 hypothetical protein NYQ88_03400 [Devosia sp. SD17-2]
MAEEDFHLDVPSPEDTPPGDTGPIDTPPVVVDPLAVDWCARAVLLRKVEEALLMGEMITEARFGTDMNRFAAAGLETVQRELEKAIRQCRISRGERPKRTRFAMSGRMTRPY